MKRLSREPQSIFFKKSKACQNLEATSRSNGISWLCIIAGLATIFLIGVFVCACQQKSVGGKADTNDIQQLRTQAAELSLRKQVLAAKYSLAQKTAPYLVVNLSNRSIELQARGRTLRAFNIVEVDKRSVTGVLNDAWTVQEKKPFERSERPKVLPGQGDAAAAEAAKKALWGPDRMPADYDLICEGDKTLEIRSLPSQQGSSIIGRWTKSIYRRLVEQYRRMTASRNSKGDSQIQLWLSENDAKMLFWSLPKQLEVLVVEGVSLAQDLFAVPSNPEASSANPPK